MVGRPTLRWRLLLAWGASVLLLVGVLGVVFTALLTDLHVERARTDIGTAFDRLAGHLREDHRAVGAAADKTAGRDDVVGALYLVSAFEDPERYERYIFDVEKSRLATGFAELAAAAGLDLVAACDARLVPVAFHAGGPGAPLTGFMTVIGGQRVPVGAAQPLDAPARILTPPAMLDAFRPAVLPDAVTVEHRVHDGRLYHTATAPVVRRLPGGGAAVVGAITVARALDPWDVAEAAVRSGVDILLAGPGSSLPAPFADLDLDATGEPLPSDALPGDHSTAGRDLEGAEHFLRVAWLPLEEGGRLYIVIARRRSDLDAGLAAFHRATLLALAGSAAVFVPVGGWVLRRSLSGRLERLAEGAAAMQQGRYTPIDPQGPDDEVTRVVRAFNAMAVGVATREALLRAGLERYRDLYDSAPAAFVSVRATDKRILRCNRAFERLLGYGAQELALLSITDLYADTPYGKEAARRVYAGFRKGEPVHHAELQMRRSDGRPVWVSVSTEPVRDAAGTVVEGRSVVIDIDHRKRAADGTRPLKDR